jgi:acylphosphatase
MRIARRCLVSGRVQGVYYRASARERALDLGVHGFARNLPDGRVEVLATGEEAVVASLIEWLRMGPPTARVDHVEVLVIEPAERAAYSDGFTIE